VFELRVNHEAEVAKVTHHTVANSGYFSSQVRFRIGGHPFSCTNTFWRIDHLRRSSKETVQQMANESFSFILMTADSTCVEDLSANKSPTRFWALVIQTRQFLHMWFNYIRNIMICVFNSVAKDTSRDLWNHLLVPVLYKHTLLSLIPVTTPTNHNLLFIAME
jgi:hypothetical protein